MHITTCTAIDMWQTPVTLPDFFNGKRVCVFAVPGPFTPGCTKVHAPGFIEAVRNGSFRSKGIEHVYCVSSADGKGSYEHVCRLKACGARK
jgi:peroxiredoxin